MSDRSYAIVIVGASGLTGRLVAAQVARQAHRLGGTPADRRWAAAGRDRERVASGLSGIAGGAPDILEVDLMNAAALPAMTRRAAVVVNLAGPYTPAARNLIAACVATGTHYADLSGEIPLLRAVIDRFHDAAAQAGVRIVQMAGWEALPADLTTLLASRRAVSGRLEGPGAGGAVRDVLVTARFERTPEGRLPLGQAVSAGTLASLVTMLDDDQAALIGRTDALLPPSLPGGRRPTALRLRPVRSGEQRLAPFAPVAFLNAPIVHRTAALRAREDVAAYEPARYLEGEAVGSGVGVGGLATAARAWLRSGLQGAVIGLTRAPAPLRRAVAGGLRRLVPPSGTGPSGRFQTDWDWSVEARVQTRDGRMGTATLEGRGHPGYQATAAMIAELGLRMALGRAPERFGCLTPALALGSLDEDPWFVNGLRLR